MPHLYSPEHIEKAGYSAAKLLENVSNRDSNAMYGGGDDGDNHPNGQTHESLLERIKDLQVPIGLVSRRYAPSGKCEETDYVTVLDKHIFDNLETMIFKGNGKGSKETRKNLNGKDSKRTRKNRKEH
jgi:hypothetical protein